MTDYIKISTTSLDTVLLVAGPDDDNEFEFDIVDERFEDYAVYIKADDVRRLINFLAGRL